MDEACPGGRLVLREATRFDFLKLHFVILLWGFTAILGTLIDLPSVEVVFVRSGLAAFMLLGIGKGIRKTSRRDAVQFTANGLLIGIHWVLFFAAAKVANVSVCMIGMATVSLWTAVLEPMMERGRSIRWKDIVLGTVIIAAVIVIVRGDAFQSDDALVQGMVLAVAAAFVAAVFSIINGKFSGRAEPSVIVAFEMAGAAAICGAAMLIHWQLADAITGMDSVAYTWPSLSDWGWMMILVTVCTVYAYTQYVELLQRMTVFTINFANNMEPIYGIALGALIFQDHEQVDAGFYAGAAAIALTVAVQPYIDRPARR